MNLIVDALEGAGRVVSCELEFPVTTIPWLHRGARVRMVEARGGVVRAEDVLAAAGRREVGHLPQPRPVFKRPADAD